VTDRFRLGDLDDLSTVNALAAVENVAREIAADWDKRMTSPEPIADPGLPFHMAVGGLLGEITGDVATLATLLAYTAGRVRRELT
jgi:hypothetical protein